MKKLFHGTVWVLFFWVMLGSSILIYYQNIDGVWNPPITFGMDPQNLKTDKLEYKPGDSVSVQFTFCRHRAFTADSQWKLVNEIVIFYPQQSFILKPECQTGRWVKIAEIPANSLTGLHHLEGVTIAHVNALRSINYIYKTQGFNIIK